MIVKQLLTKTNCILQTNIKIFILLLPLLFGMVNGNAQAHLIKGESIYDLPPLEPPGIKSQPDRSTSGVPTSRSVMMGPILYDQSELINFAGQGAMGADVSATTGQLFGVFNDINSNLILADEFTVPPGELWIVDSIIVFHYQTGSTLSSPINDIRLQVRQGSVPGSGSVVFGDLSTNRLANSYFSGIYRTRPIDLVNVERPIMRSRVNTNVLSLSSGTYVVEYLAGGTLASGPSSPLRTTSTTHIPTGNAFQFNMTWNNIFELDANGNDPQPKGTVFMVYGVNCTPPDATFTASASTCTGNVENNNGTIAITTQSNVTHFGISSPGAMSYNGPTTIGAATVIPVNGTNVVTGVQHAGSSYIIRLFNGLDGCFTDVNVNVPSGPVCPMTSTFDLALTKTIANISNPAVIGDMVTYNITIINEGTLDASNVIISDFIPTGLSLADPNWTAVGNTATLNSPIALIPAMSQTTLNISFVINNMASGLITNTAEIIQASGGTDDDSTPGNGTAATNEDDFGSAAFTVCILPTLIVKNDTVCRGSDVDLGTLVVSNNGDDLDYYLSNADALSNTNAIPTPSVVVNSATNYFIKSSFAPVLANCGNIQKVTVFLKSANCVGISVSGP
ncbi:MAG: DUF11 domain-containing protein [Saprospiraceae bacterium]|nr:DUF11 domain-containing protein [Saprospiraceae bacterium]